MSDAPEPQQPAPIAAPGLDGAVDWLNVAAPVSLAELRGKVVILDFWSYGCINFMHVLRDLKTLEQRGWRETSIFIQFPRKIQHRSGAQALKIHGIEGCKGRDRCFRLVNQQPNQPLFRLGDLPEAGKLAGRNTRLFLRNGLSNLRPDDILRDAGLVRKTVGEKISHRHVRNSGGNRQNLVEEFHTPFVTVQVVTSRDPVEQIFQIRL